MDRAWRIGIVGGGPGGLMTAYCLQKLADRPLEMVLFEATDRLGGKILTRRFATHGVRYEAGAAEFYDYSPVDDDPLKSLIAELGLPMFPMGGPAVIMRNGILANLDDIGEQLGPRARDSLLRFDRLVKDAMTPQRFYAVTEPDFARGQPDAGRFDAMLRQIDDPDARGYVENLIHSDLAAEPCHTNLSYGLQNYLMNDPAYMHVYGIEGGNERLPQELAARCAAAIRLEHRVGRISRTDDARIRVRTIHHGTPAEEEFDFVVVALPHNQLMSIEFEGDRLASAVRDHHAQHDHPAHYLRVTLLFDEPFWKEAFSDSYWMLDRFGGCCLYDESLRDPERVHGILGWLIGGDAARDMSGLGDEELIAAALESLPSFLAHGRGHFLEGRVHRWVAAVSAMPTGAVPWGFDERHQPEPVEHPNLMLVGDYLFDSTINGVLDSAQYVAGWIAANMSEHQKEQP